MLNDNDEDLFPELVAPPEKVVEYEPPEDISQHIPEEPIEEQEEEIIQHPEPKEILKKNDIFISKPSSKKKIKVENNDEPEEGEPLDIVPVKKPRKKRVMTEEHKAKLALARQKGMETRKRNAELRRQAKEQKLKEKEDNREEKEIIKAVRRKRIAKLKKELDSDEDEPIEKPKQKQEPQTKDIEKIIEISCGDCKIIDSEYKATLDQDKAYTKELDLENFILETLLKNKTTESEIINGTRSIRSSEE